MSRLQDIDPELFQILEKEELRQRNTINLIASENYTSPAVLQATASILTNKYAEGYPGKRYYGGCVYVDHTEILAQDRLKKLFGAEHANVQPHAGSQANMAVYAAILKPGDTILGMSLAEGGHLTHGHKVNFSGTWYTSIQYGLHRDTELLDYDEIQRLADLHKPRLIIAGASAYSRSIDFKRFREIADSVGAYLLADCAHIAGPIIAGLHPNPFPYADFVTLTTHKTMRGPRGGAVMCKKEYAQMIDRAIMPGLQGGPFMHVIAAKAVAFKLALQDDFIKYQRQVIANARAMAQEFTRRGYRIVSGGTDNHLFVVDMTSKNLNGKIAEQVLDQIGISVSRSCIPRDILPPSLSSGIRVGTPAITTQGADESLVREIVTIIDEAFLERHNQETLTRLAAQVQAVCAGLLKKDIVHRPADYKQYLKI